MEILRVACDRPTGEAKEPLRSEFTMLICMTIEVLESSSYNSSSSSDDDDNNNNNSSSYGDAFWWWK